MGCQNMIKAVILPLNLAGHATNVNVQDMGYSDTWVNGVYCQSLILIFSDFSMSKKLLFISGSIDGFVHITTFFVQYNLFFRPIMTFQA